MALVLSLTHQAFPCLSVSALERPLLRKFFARMTRPLTAFNSLLKCHLLSTFLTTTLFKIVTSLPTL